MQNVPNVGAPLVKFTVIFNGKRIEGTGTIIPPWNSFFQQFTQDPPIARTVTGINGVMTFTPNTIGNLFIIGGTVSLVTLTRGLVSLTLTGQRIIPICIKDTVEVHSADASYTFLETFGNQSQL